MLSVERHLPVGDVDSIMDEPLFVVQAKSTAKTISSAIEKLFVPKNSGDFTSSGVIDNAFPSTRLLYGAADNTLPPAFGVYDRRYRLY